MGTQTNLRRVDRQAIHRLIAPFFDLNQKNGSVFIAACCQYVFVGLRRADVCGTCHQRVENLRVSTVEEAVALGRIEHPAALRMKGD